MNPWTEIVRAARTLRRSPGFAVACVLTLALGIGANTTVFSVVYAVLLRPLPYPDANRICLVWKSVPKKNISRDWTSYPTVADWKRDNASFEDIAAFLRPDGAHVDLTGSDTEQAQAAKVSANFFAIARVTPLLGRTFDEGDAAHGERLVVLSRGFWQRRFGAANDVIGKALEIDHEPFRVIGVMPASFELPYKEADFWIPLPTDSRWERFQAVRFADAFGAMARLKAGTTPAQAQSDMAAVSERLAREYPQTDRELATEVVTLPRYIAGPRLRLTLWLFLAGVALVLLIACANVSGLFFGRAYERRRNFAIQIALGARRSDILWQLFSEATALVLASGALGVLLAEMGIRAVAVVAPEVPGLGNARLNGHALAFAFGVSFLCAALVSIGPGWRAASNSAQEALRERDFSGGRARSRVHAMLVFGESALAIVLLAGTGLLLRSLIRLEQAPLGFRPDHLVTTHVQLSGRKYATDDQIRAFVSEWLERTRALPGVKSAAIGAAFLPRVPDLQISIDGIASPSGASHYPVTWTYVSEDYFQTMGIPLASGRTFTVDDRADSLPVIVVNQTMKRQFFGGTDPVGRRVRFGKPGFQEKQILTVAGVVGDVVQNGPEAAPIAVFYFPVRQRVWDSLDLVVRTDVAPGAVGAAVGAVIHRLDPTIQPSSVTTIQQQLRELESPRRFQIDLFGVFSLLAVGLAAVGVFGVMAHAVTHRTREIGMRMALGAQRNDILRMVMRDALAPVMGGLIAGVFVSAGAAIALTSKTTGLLYGVKATDPITYVSVCTVLLFVAALAAYVPARRAMQTDPIEALRGE